ncbi:MAG: hypothetical protein QOE34_2284, partial [Verrucomicrobiota bacterium]
MMKALADLYWGAIALAVLSGPMIAVGAPGDLYVNSGFQPGNILRIAPDGTISNFTTGLDGPWGLAFDAAGILFESDNTGGIIYKFTKDGSRTTVGVLSNVTGLAIDASGNVYAADNSFGNIYRYAPDGTRTTFATGTGHPSHLAFDSSGNLFLTNSDFNVGTGTIVKISPNGEKSTFTTKLDAPSGLAFDRSGNLFVTEERGGTILRFTPNGSRTTFATGLNSPSGLAFDSSGNLFEIDMTANAFGGNGSINKFTPDGTKSTFATNFSLPESLAFEPGPETLLNISTRMRVLTGDNVLIGGFIITGADPKKV